MTQSDYEFERIKRLIEQIKRFEEMAKKAERVPDKYKGDIIKIKPPTPHKTARKKAAPAKPASIYPPWPKV